MPEPSPRDIDVLSFGESLVDFLPDRRGVPLRRVENFRKVVGGAPTNLALGVGRLGRKAALIGKIGADEFGDFIVGTLDRTGVVTEGIHRTDQARTGLTFVTLDADGDRSFLFYRNPSADELLEPGEVDPDLIARSRIFQVGSNMLTDERLRRTTLRALELAEQADCLVSVDPNIRLHLWDDRDEARRQVLELVESADLVKLNEEELDFLAGERTLREAWAELFAPREVALLVVTLAGRGARALGPGVDCRVDAPEVEVTDTTGAGDGFLSGMLGGLSARLDAGPDEPPAATLAELTGPQLEPILELGCHVGSTVCTELGATPPLPELADLPDPLREMLS